MHTSFRKTLIGAGLLGAVIAGGAASTFASSASTDSSAVVVSAAVDTADSTTTMIADDTVTDDTVIVDDTVVGDSTTPVPADAPPPRDPSMGGHMANGVTEELLTGDEAARVTEAALAAVPGATIERVETDAEGAAFEAHIVTADGAHQTVTFNADYSVASIEDGPAGGPGGHGGHGGPPPAADAADAATTTG